MAEFVDMHCHVLPGVDDGPATMEDSMAILAEAARQGIDAMIVTPHFHPGRYIVSAPQIMEVLDQVRREVKSRGIPIRLIPGQECYYFSGLVHELDAGKAMTMAHTAYVLVEFDRETLYSKIQYAVRELTDNGYRPIIAHYERYRCLVGKPDRLDELMDQGAKLQMNADRLLEKEGLFRPNPWRRLLKEGYVDFLGSDTHGMNFRPLHMGKALDWLESNVSEELCDRILVRNIQLLLPPDSKGKGKRRSDG